MEDNPIAPPIGDSIAPPSGDELAGHVEAIYGVDLPDFTGERDRRVKELKAEGHKEAAKALQAHRKPTVPAWTVDQLARQAPDDIDALLAAAEELRTAQHRAASGRGAEGMREASRRLRDLVGDLRHRAARILADAGTRPDAHLDEVEQTLFAAAVEPGHHDTLRRGIFAAVLPGPGFGGMGLGLVAVPDLPADPPRKSAREPRAEPQAGGDEGSAERREQERAEAERRAEEERRAEAERQAEQARLLAGRRRELQRRIDALEGARDKQLGRVERARTKAEDLQARADAARAEADAAGDDLADYERDLAAAREELEALDDGG